MILAELVGLVASYLSVFIPKPLQITPRYAQREYGSTSDENHEQEPKWEDMINREYETENGSELQQQTDYHSSVNYISVGKELHMKPSFWQSFQRSLRANLGIMIAVMPLGLLAISLVYFNLNTSNLCIEAKHHNHSIPFLVTRWILLGEDITTIPLNMWFPFTLVLLFGWKKYKSNYISTLYIGFAVAAAQTIYDAYLFVFGVYGTKLYYRYPGDVLFFAAMIYNGILVAKKFRKVCPSTTYSTFHIFFMSSSGIVTACTIGVVYRFSIVPYYNQLEDEVSKAILAAITPAVALIPTAICEYFALRQSSEMIQPGRSFVLAYFMRGLSIGLYRIMQADFKSLTLFVGLSLLHGFSNVFSKATEGLREKIWTRLGVYLTRTYCGRRLEILPLNTPHHRRLKADIEIQNILFEYNTLILSQAYLVLYLITSFDISSWPVIKESVVRMAIGLGIDFFFNCISVFIQIHYHDVPMRRVWFKCWKRHVFANATIIMVIVFYLTRGFLAVFQARRDESAEEYAIKNCTLPFERW